MNSTPIFPSLFHENLQLDSLHGHLPQDEGKTDYGVDLEEQDLKILRRIS